MKRASSTGAQILFVLVACLLAGCGLRPRGREATGLPGEALLLSRLLTSSNSSAPTLFWGTLQNPGNFILGGHVQGGLANVLAILTNARVQRLAVELPEGASSEFRKEIHGRLDAGGINVKWFGRPNREQRDGVGSSWVRKPRPGTYVLFRETFPLQDGWFLGSFVGRDAVVVARRLGGSRVDHVVFESAFKLTPDTVASVTASFVEAGVSFDHFWVPWSQRPGAVDLSEPPRSLQH